MGGGGDSRRQMKRDVILRDMVKRDMVERDMVRREVRNRVMQLAKLDPQTYPLSTESGPAQAPIYADLR